MAPSYKINTIVQKDNNNMENHVSTKLAVYMHALFVQKTSVWYLGNENKIQKTRNLGKENNKLKAGVKFRM